VSQSESPASPCDTRLWTAAEKDQQETVKVHRLEELEEKLAEIEQKEIERHVHEKEEVPIVRVCG